MNEPADEAPTLPLAGGRREAKRANVSCALFGSIVAFVVALLVVSALFAGFVYSRPRRQSGGFAPGTTLPIDTKPAGDSRTYQFSVLANGIKVVNVRDESALTDAWSVAVKAGSLDDPHQVPGLAHFCEHMLFLGTASYPEASGYDDFVNAHGGSLNAYTADQTTVYYTEITKGTLDEGLNRFGDFFRAPLFDRNFVKKEVHAIDSEHAKNKQDPNWRLMAVINALASPLNPVSQFHTGNLETLERRPARLGVDIVDALRLWFEAHYCPSRMHLVTYSSESMDAQLAKVQKSFGNISSGNALCQGRVKSWEDPNPWPPDRLAKWVTVLGTQPQAHLVLFFPVPDLLKEFMSQPGSYIAYVLTYGGEQSLVTALRDHGLASDVQVSIDAGSAGSSVSIDCSLARWGREEPGLILDVFFGYVSELRRKRVDAKLYSSIANLSRVNWDWASQMDPASAASTLAERLTRLPPAHLLSGDQIIEDADPGMVAELLQHLHPRNMNAVLLDPRADKTFRGKPLHRLPEYDVRYTVEPLELVFQEKFYRWGAWLRRVDNTTVTEDLEAIFRERSRATFSPPVPPNPIDVSTTVDTENMQAARAPERPGEFDAALFGPPPERLDSERPAENHTSSTDSVAPVFIQESDSNSTKDDFSRSWYRRGWVNPTPQVYMQAYFRPFRTQDQWEPSAADAMRLALYNALLAEELEPRMFNRTVVGASYSVDFSTRGLEIGFSGFPEMVPALIEGVLADVARGPDVTDMGKFDRVKQRLMENLRSYSSMPVDYAVDDRDILITAGRHSHAESLTALTLVGMRSANSAARDILLNQPLDMTSLVMGNFPENRSREAVDSIKGGVSNFAAPGIRPRSGEVMFRTPVVNPGQPLELRKRNPRASDPNDVVVVSLLANASTVESRVLYGLLAQMLSQLAYDELRTNQQLGYVVAAGDLLISNVNGMSIVVQGNAINADAMEAAVEAVYFGTMTKYLEDLTDKDFDSIRHAYKQELLKPPLGYAEEFRHFWSPITSMTSDDTCLGLRNNMVTFLEQGVTSKQPLVDAWARLVFPVGGTRKKIVVKYFASFIPPRPGTETSRALWTAHNVPATGVEHLLTEHAQTLVLDRADSSVRSQLAKAGGYFPQTLDCGMPRKESAPPKADNETSGQEAPGKSAEPSSDLPPQLRRMMRGQGIPSSTFLGTD